MAVSHYLDGLPEGIDPALTDLLYMVFDPATTPVDRKVTRGNLLGATLTALAALVTTAFGRSLLVLADAAAGRTALGLGNVTNTSDAAKPVSTAQQTALNLKADKTLDTVLASGGTTVTDKTPNSLTYVQWGTEEATVAQADAPTSVVVLAWLTGVLRAGPGTITALSDRGLAKLQVSYDGGSNFADLGPECNVTVLSTNTFRGASVATQGRGTGTVTGSVQVRAMCRDSEAANDCTFFGGFINLLVHPQ